MCNPLHTTIYYDGFAVEDTASSVSGTGRLRRCPSEGRRAADDGRTWPRERERGHAAATGPRPGPRRRGRAGRHPGCAELTAAAWRLSFGEVTRWSIACTSWRPVPGRRERLDANSPVGRFAPSGWRRGPVHGLAVCDAWRDSRSSRCRSGQTIGRLQRLSPKGEVVRRSAAKPGRVRGRPRQQRGSPAGRDPARSHGHARIREHAAPGRASSVRARDGHGTPEVLPTSLVGRTGLRRNLPTLPRLPTLRRLGLDSRYP